MADSAVAVTAGTGTSIDTRTEGTNGNHRQVVVLGDPATNAGVAPVDATAGLKVDLGADNDVTVTGTVTAELSATDNAVLDDIAADTESIKTAVEVLDNAISGSEMQVDVVTLPGTVATDITAVKTAVEILDNAVSGSEMQVDVITMPTVTVDSELPAAAALADNTANPTVPGVGAYLLGMDSGGTWDRIQLGTQSADDLGAALASTQGINTRSFLYGYNGTTWDRLRTDTTNGLDVDVTRVIPGTSATHLGKAEDAAHSSGDTGVMALGVRRDTPTVSSGTDGDYEPVSMDANGATWVSLATKLDTTNDAVAIGPRTSGGLTIFRSLDLDESEEEVKASAGQVYGWFISNLSASTVYIKFYNATTANVTVGTTTPVMTIPLEADQASNVEFTNGIAFGTAITVAATTGVADSDTTGPGANEVVVNIFYK